MVNLNYMVWGGVNPVVREYNNITAIYPDLAKQYSLSIISAGPNDANVANSLRLALAAGKNIPDIVAINRTQLAEFVDAGEVTELTDAFAPIKDDLYAGALNLAPIIVRLWPFPVSLKANSFTTAAICLIRLASS